MSNVVAEVAELAAQAESAENNEQFLEEIIDNAIEKENAAQELAEEITRAAIESERGKQIEDLRREIFTWQEKYADLLVRVEQAEFQIAEMKGQLSALATLNLTETPLSSTVLSSIPAQLTTATEQALEVLEPIVPEAVAENVVVENPALNLQKANRRWI